MSNRPAGSARVRLFAKPDDTNICPLFLAERTERNSVGNARRSLVRMAFRGVDPTQVGVPVKLGEAVEEGGGRRFCFESGSQIGGELVALGSFGSENYGHQVTGLDAAIAAPRWSEHNCAAIVQCLEGGPNAHPVYTPSHVVRCLDAPLLVGVERQRDQDAPCRTDDDCRFKVPSALWLVHESILASPGPNGYRFEGDERRMWQMSSAVQLAGSSERARSTS